MNGAPPREITIDVALVRALLAEQLPDLAGLPLSELAEGWDNVIYRLGDAWTVRLPRRFASVELVCNEQRWLPQLAPALPLPVPVPTRFGTPSAALGYPCSWHVAPWLQGVPWEHAPPRDLAEAARCLGGFLRAMHQPAPADAPLNPYRGTPLHARTERLHQGLDTLGERIDRRLALSKWDALLTTPGWERPPVWLHGDLHPLNMLVEQGTLSAVIDFGDVCAGDPASDLAVAWMVFDARARAILRDAAHVDDATWRRGQGWALALGVALANGDQRVSAIGSRTLTAVLASEDA